MDRERRSEEQPAERNGPEVCKATREILSRFVHRSLSARESRAFRQHLVGCEDCAERYRATMASAAQVGSAVRQMRSEEERERRHDELVRRAVAAGGRPPKQRRFGLRLMLLPVGMILLLVFLGRGVLGTGSPVLKWGHGEAHAGGELVDADHPEIALEEGDWCRTSVAGGARIEMPAASFELGGDTQLLIEDPNAARLRLQRGEILASGPCVVTSAFGVLQVSEGRVRLGVRSGRYHLQLIEGQASWTGPTGVRRLAVGERLGSDTPLAN